MTTVAGASREFKASDLRDDDTKLQILLNTNAEVLILGVQTSDEDVAAEMNLVAWAPPAPMANPQFDVSYRHEVHHSLSDLAFAGKSFELRRWNGQALTLPGFRADVADKKELVGLGYQHELRQAQSLRPSLPHPLSIKGFPIRMDTLINNQQRQIVPIGDKLLLNR